MSPRSPDLPSPAVRRAFFCVLAACLLPALSAQPSRYRPPPNQPAEGAADQAEGARILGDFRHAGIAGTYWLGFELRVMPRRGPERVLKGEMFGRRGDLGPLTRLSVAGERRLIQGVPFPAAWAAPDGAAAAQPLSAAAGLEPIAGTDLTVFDLQMPFLQWSDFVYEGLARNRGRPAHSFVLYPPADLAAARPELTGVRILIDTQYQAMVQAALLGPKGEPEKTITVLDLKKSGDQWLVKSIDLRNHVTRDKTRFQVTAAALNLDLPPEAFAPEQLTSPPPLVPAEQIERF
ncbi:MAG: outer membrane lipoprotein-sorting protein [Opitutaceae bacterium]|nr:outer membrane lipoprotein-sorting protein [Opitutaceae bacterium]